MKTTLLFLILFAQFCIASETKNAPVPYSSGTANEQPFASKAFAAQPVNTYEQAALETALTACMPIPKKDGPRKPTLKWPPTCSPIPNENPASPKMIGLDNDSAD